MPRKLYVPIPSHEDIDQVTDGPNLSSFVDMCHLTVILDTLLPLLDDVQRTEEITLGQHRSVLLKAAKDVDLVCDGLSSDSPSKLPGQRKSGIEVWG